MLDSQLKRCLKIYSRSECDFRTKMMAFCFDNKKLISTGINSNKTEPLQATFGAKYRQKINYKSHNFYIDKRHCEIDCLKELYRQNRDFSKLSIFILSVRSDGSFRESKPCPVCMEFLNTIGIGEINYYHNNKLITERII